MKILSVHQQNYKRIAVIDKHVDKSGNLITVTGQNEQGKSSLIDGIEATIHGASVIPPRPVRKGQDKAALEVVLGKSHEQVELVVKRTISANGNTNLVVTNKEGVKQQSPQAILDSLYANLSFDPLAFAKMPPTKRSETIRQLLQLDFTELDQKREALFIARTDVNRVAKAKEAMLTTNRRYEGVPADLLSASEIMAEQEAAVKLNQANSENRNLARNAKIEAEGAERRLASQKGEVARIEAQIATLTEALKTCQESRDGIEKEFQAKVNRWNALDAEVANLKDVSLSEFSLRLSEVEVTNNKIRKNKEVDKIETERRAAVKESNDISKKIDDLDSKRREMISGAKFPVTGMSLGDSGEVLLHGLPFEQASTKGQLMASLAMGAALNPKLRVLLVKSGNDLDKNAMIGIAEWADKNDFQVWLERIEPGDNPTIIIEDGRAIERDVAELALK